MCVLRRRKLVRTAFTVPVVEELNRVFGQALGESVCASRTVSNCPPSKTHILKTEGLRPNSPLGRVGDPTAQRNKQAPWREGLRIVFRMCICGRKKTK